MSSSNSAKILRSGALGQQPLVLGALGGALPARESEFFRPVALGGEEPEPEVEEELPPPPPTILEEEALRRIELAHQEGLKKGRELAEAELSKVSEALAQALLATGALRGKVMNEAEEDLLKLSVLIARKVMLRELAADPGALSALVRGAVELAADGAEIVVRLNPEDQAVVAHSTQFQELMSEVRCVTLKGDAAVPRAGCLVETERGNIDAGLDAQLDEIYRALAEERSARRGGFSG